MLSCNHAQKVYILLHAPIYISQCLRGHTVANPSLGLCREKAKKPSHTGKKRLLKVEYCNGLIRNAFLSNGSLLLRAATMGPEYRFT